MPFAVFSASDAAVLVALIGAFAAIFGPVVLLMVSSLKRIREAAERAAHNTQPNGELDERGDRTPPSPYDLTAATHEYIIGQIHEVAEEARAAARGAARARAVAAQTDEKVTGLKQAAKKTDEKLDALSGRVDEGFAAAKEERGILGDRLDANIAGGRLFAEGIAVGSLSVSERLDALDGRNSVEELRVRLQAAGLVQPAPGHESEEEAADDAGPDDHR